MNPNDPSSMMPPLPPSLQPQPEGVNKRLLLLALVGGVVAVVIIVVLVLSSGHNNKNPISSNGTGSSSSPGAGSPTPTSTTSSSSLASPTPTPTNTAKAPTGQPSFNNFDALTDAGFTANQLEDLEYALGKYGQSIGDPGAIVTLNTSSIKSSAPNPNDPNASPGLRYTFSLTYLGRATYNATAVLTSTTAGSFQLFSTVDGSTAYSSGTIDLYNGIGD